MAIEIKSVHERRLPRLRRAASRFGERLGELRQLGGRGKTFLRIFIAALTALCLLAAAVTVQHYRRYSELVDERLAAGYLMSRAGVYAAPRVLRAGQKLTPGQLAEALRRAGYAEGEAGGDGVWSGRFRAGDDAVEIFPRRQKDDDGTPSVVRVSFDGRGRVAGLSSESGALPAFALEPEPLTTDAALRAGEKTGSRAALSYREIPAVLVRAILAIEDRRFFEHAGVDPVGVARAVFANGTGEGDSKQGGSTITQQLVKNTYLTPERTLRRKYHEAIISAALERRLSKEDIFALYCDEIYLGRRGSLSVRGVGQAARVYFGKELKDLSLAEAATIAGMIQSPGRYAPDRHPERARARRAVVLDAMLREGFIGEEENRAAAGEELQVVAADGADAAAPYFVDYVNRLVEPQADDESIAGGNDLRVHTTIDLELQRVAEEAVSRQLERLDKVFKGKRTPQAALVALDPHTGHVLAMVGGRDYGSSQLNRATDARRQPGSVFKPFVYAAAIEAGISPVSLSLDAPRDFVYDRRAHYRPANYGGRYSMRDVTLRAGLVRSLNVVTVDVAMRAGLNRVAVLAEQAGLPKPEPYPSLALGTFEATPLEVASAYTAFAGGGRAVRPSALYSVEEASRPLPARGRISAPVQVFRPSTAYMITDMLTAVVREGTARAARGSVRGAAIAGKTGTSRDGWFAGYTPNLVCVVWVGFDDNEPLGLTGAESALPAWAEFMRKAVDLRPELGGAGFSVPEGVAEVEVDPETGALATPSCPHGELVPLTPALTPQSACLAHLEPPEPLVAEIVIDEDGAPLEPPHDRRPPETFFSHQHTHRAARVAKTDAPASRATSVTSIVSGQTRLTNEVEVVVAGGGWPR